MSKDMKTIMESWRRTLEEESERISDEEMQAMFQQALKDLNLAGLTEDSADKLFRGMVTGGLLAVMPLIYGAYTEKAEDKVRARQATAQSAERLASTNTKITELSGELNTNTQAWTWSDDTLEDPATGEKYKDPHSTEMFPKVKFSGDEMVVLAPSWSIAMQVLKDKQAGTINVPGFNEGELPPLDIIIKAMNRSGNFTPVSTDTEAIEFVGKFKGYLLNTSDMGASDIQTVGGVVCNGKIGCNTVAVNPEVFSDMPEYIIPTSGQTAQGTYIKYFFQYLGTEEALKYGGAK
tara:strand:+ start:178 stop:1053 length:876 start_codon:yes stop_codon:yes gene_type:complete